MRLISVLEMSFLCTFQATSKLLPGYPEELRDQILDYLFKVSLEYIN